MNGGAWLAGVTAVVRSPAAALFALGLGLCAALCARREHGAPRGVRGTLAVLGALVAGWLGGGVYAALHETPDATTWLALASVPLIGVCVALDVGARRPLLVALAAVGGALHGATGATAGEPGAALGSAACAGALAALGATAARLVRGPRTRIAARVAGSWIAAIGVLLVAWHARPQLAPTVDGCAACVEAKLANAWCESCSIGWVASFEVRSRMLFDALDAHGHDLDRDVMQCETCKRLADEGGFCEACRFGWVGGQAYMSRLTYHLAKGTPRDPRDIDCARCAELFGRGGWCQASGGGWAGNVWFLDRADHADALRELDRLHAANEAAARCENCALAILVDGKCPYCRVRYVLGNPVEAGGG